MAKKPWGSRRASKAIRKTTASHTVRTASHSLTALGNRSAFRPWRRNHTRETTSPIPARMGPQWLNMWKIPQPPP